MKGLTACGGEIGLELKTEPFLGSALPSQRFRPGDRREGGLGGAERGKGRLGQNSLKGTEGQGGGRGRRPRSPREWVSGWLRKPAKKAE